MSERGIAAAVHSKGLREKYDCQGGLPPVKAGQHVASVDPRYFRPTEVDTLLGDATKARKELGWHCEISFSQLIQEMIVHDLKEAAREAICIRNGFALPSSCEALM